MGLEDEFGGRRVLGGACRVGVCGVGFQDKLIAGAEVAVGDARGQPHRVAGWVFSERGVRSYGVEGVRVVAYIRTSLCWQS